MIRKTACSGLSGQRASLKLGGLMALLRLGGGFFRLATAVGALLLSLVVGMGLFVVFAALSAEEEQNLLRVATGHVKKLTRFWSTRHHG